MNKFLISYDLGGPETRLDYVRLINYIKTYENWAKPLQSVWIILTDQTAEEVRDGIKNHIDSNDKIMIIEVTGNWATFGIKKEVTDWMQGLQD
ncbi:hypothetical protein A2765_05975 [Candidatus Kaiserbacteria bacterium RIFCSPHIGHO2_01_FULL_56_24]|uniref:SinR family protein n=1 Tax=Candidatus Kaiserbacteria bacterium RIFCSPHIGHO2_01_FULL_56_24 TaxID=1798487 RepID=A0A1F6D897_9BACT|nr:MAG: hypothetical protein A2765_05975 [Candidatus Kaiserbacteria bacterium RIFCSPHIGHO2_01_FULL_56_24]